MSYTVWQLHQTIVLLVYSAVVLAGLVLLVAFRKKLSGFVRSLLAPAMLLVSVPGPMVVGTLMRADAYHMFLYTHVCGRWEVKCDSYASSFVSCEQIVQVAAVCSLILAVVAIGSCVLLLRARRDGAAGYRSLVPYVLVLVVAACIMAGPPYRKLLAGILYGECIHLGEDGKTIPVLRGEGRAYGKGVFLTPYVQIMKGSILVDDVKVADLDGWAVRYRGCPDGYECGLEGPLGDSVKSLVEKERALCQRAGEGPCELPDIVLVVDGKAPLETVVEVIRAASGSWEGPFAFLLRTEPASGTGPGLDEVLRRVSDGERMRCTIACPYVLLGVVAGPEEGAAVLAGDPGMTFGEYIQGLDPSVSGVFLEAEEAPVSASWRMSDVLEGIEYPIEKDELLGRLGVPEEDRLLFLWESHCLDDPCMQWHHHFLDGGCSVRLRVYRETYDGPWLVAGTEAECEGGLDLARDGALQLVLDGLPEGWIARTSGKIMWIEREVPVTVVFYNQSNRPPAYVEEPPSLEELIERGGRQEKARIVFRVEPRWSAEKLEAAVAANDAIWDRIWEKEKEVRHLKKPAAWRTSSFEYWPKTQEDRKKVEEFQEERKELASKFTAIPEYSSDLYSLFILDEVGKSDDRHIVVPEEAVEEFVAVKKALEAILEEAGFERGVVTYREREERMGD